MNQRAGYFATGTALAVAALVSAGGAQALEISLSGQINRAIMVIDDGEDSQTAFVDNQASNSRFRLTGSHEIQPGLSAGVAGEFSMVSNSSSSITIDNTSTDFSFGERKIEAFFSGGFGKVSLGQGDGAANGVAEVDLSGTTVVQYTGIAGDLGGGIQFRDDAAGFGPSIGDTYSQFDFESRYDRLRYDTPSVGPFGFAASVGAKGASDDVVELAARYGSDVTGVGRVAAALGYAKRHRGGMAGSDETLGGSASLLLASGINATLGYTRKENDADLDADNVYVKLGYTAGDHAVAIDYGRTSDLFADGSESDVYGLGYVYTPVGWAELYAGAKVHSLDVDGASYDDITTMTVGTRLKF